MFNPQFIIKGIDRDGREVLTSGRQFSSRYSAELASLEFYGDNRYKIVWVELFGYAEQAA